MAVDLASAQLKGDRKILLAAVSQNGHALHSASAELKGDREVVTRAVSKDWGCSKVWRRAGLKGTC